MFSAGIQISWKRKPLVPRKVKSKTLSKILFFCVPIVLPFYSPIIVNFVLMAFEDN